MSRSAYLVGMILLAGLVFVIFGLYLLATVVGDTMAGQVFIFLVTVAPGFYFVYVGVRGMRRIQKGIDFWY